MSTAVARAIKKKANPLPVLYEEAKTAIAKSASVDECKDWADKAAALRVYAKQSKDKTLEHDAIRIRARAVKRMGQLIDAVQPKAGEGSKGKNGMRGHTISKRKAADAAGISKQQQDQAVRVARVDDEQFEQQVESDVPPTVKALAEHGKAQKPLVDLGDRKPEEFAAATKLIGVLGHVERIGFPMHVAIAVRGLSESDRSDMLAQIERIREWLNRVRNGVASCQ